MNRLSPIALGLLIATPIAGHANCRAYDRSDLVEMKKDELQLEYCLNKIETRRFQRQAETSSRIADLDAISPGSSFARRQRVAASSAKSDAASSQIEQCNMMNERIASVAKKKRLSLANLEQACSKN